MAGIQIDGVNNKIDFDDDADTSISSASDDTLVVEVGGNTLATVTATSVTVNDGVEITTADNTAQLILTSTDADGNAGPVLKLTRDSGSPADEDFLGNIQIEMDNDAGDSLDAVSILAQAKDVSNASEDARLYTYVRTAGSMRDRFSIAPSETVFNEDSVDVDLRVESDINTHSLIVEGSSGHVGFGVSNPSSVIDVRNGVGERQAFVFMGVNQDTVAMAVMSSYALSSQTATMIQFLDFNGTERGSIKTSGSATAYNTSSDYRLKENINYDWDATTELKKLKPAKFNWKVDTENTVEGFLAHEVSDIVPDAITGTKDEIETKTKVIRDSANQILGEGIEEADWIAGKVDGKYPSDSTWQASETKEKYQQIDQSKLVPLMVKTIQELEARIATLEGN
jgi:hypothetical protein